MSTRSLPRITAKSTEPFTERVNGPLYIPILGDLFPRLWGDRREVQRKRLLVHTDEGTFEVSEAEYAELEVGDPCPPSPTFGL